MQAAKEKRPNDGPPKVHRWAIFLEVLERL
jgi:hypothetical protein